MFELSSVPIHLLLSGGAVLAILACQEWRFRVLPKRVPYARIEALADALIAAHGDRAEEIAFINEDRAWRYSDTVEQGTWRRVRAELRRREVAAGKA